MLKVRKPKAIRLIILVRLLIAIWSAVRSGLAAWILVL